MIDTAFIIFPDGGRFPINRYRCLSCEEKIDNGFFCSLNCANSFFIADRINQKFKTGRFKEDLK